MVDARLMFSNHKPQPKAAKYTLGGEMCAEYPGQDVSRWRSDADLVK